MWIVKLLVAIIHNSFIFTLFLNIIFFFLDMHIHMYIPTYGSTNYFFQNDNVINFQWTLKNVHITFTLRHSCLNFFFSFFFWKNVVWQRENPKNVWFFYGMRKLLRDLDICIIFFYNLLVVCTLYVHNDGLVNNQNQSFGFGDIHQQSRLNESVPVFGQWLKIGKSKTIS